MLKHMMQIKYNNRPKKVKAYIAVVMLTLTTLAERQLSFHSSRTV